MFLKTFDTYFVSWKQKMCSQQMLGARANRETFREAMRFPQQSFRVCGCLYCCLLACFCFVVAFVAVVVVVVVIVVVVAVVVVLGDTVVRVCFCMFVLAFLIIGTVLVVITFAIVCNDAIFQV